MIVQGSCAVGSFRMQPRPTDRFDAAGTLIAPMGMGLARSPLAKNRTGNGIASCRRQSLNQRRACGTNMGFVALRGRVVELETWHSPISRSIECACSCKPAGARPDGREPVGGLAFTRTWRRARERPKASR